MSAPLDRRLPEARLADSRGDGVAAEIAHYFDRLWPLLRSLTGAGLRETYDILGELLPLERMEVPTGTEVFDWTVPKEWVVRDAYLEAPNGRRILDLRDHPLHLLNYSTGFRGRVSREELDAHLHSRPDLPGAIPYVTSYYEPRWGFCLSDRQRRALPGGDYNVVVDAEHIGGALSLAEAVLPGREPDEVLLTSYTCHPALANDELCGPIALAFLYRRLAAWPERRLTYRFALHPETIGALAYLKLRGEHLKRTVKAGYVVTNVGLAAPFRYKRSRCGDSPADRAAIAELEALNGTPAVISDFEPFGSDERQYCSPGFDLPVGVIARSPNVYPEYHTSLDNRDLISFAAVAETVDLCEAICRRLEQGATATSGASAASATGFPAPEGPRYRSLFPYGEPQLGKRGLYPTLGRGGTPERRLQTLLWVLNLSDGGHDLPQIAARSGLTLAEVEEATRACLDAGLLARADETAEAPRA